MSKRKIYLVECEQIKTKKVAIVTDNENDAGNIADDLLNYGVLDFESNFAYREDFEVKNELTEKEALRYKQYKYEDIIQKLHESGAFLLQQKGE